MKTASQTWTIGTSRDYLGNCLYIGDGSYTFLRLYPASGDWHIKTQNGGSVYDRIFIDADGDIVLYGFAGSEYFRLSPSAATIAAALDLKSNVHLPVNGANTGYIGTSSVYWSEMHSKLFNDVGCIVYADPSFALDSINAIRMNKKGKISKTGMQLIDYDCVPDFVKGPMDKDEKGLPIGEKGIDLSAMISLLIGAVKALKLRVEALESKLA